MTSSKKLIRHRSLKKLLRDNPFSTDEQLAKMLDVSVQTIRLDRVALGIPELRARTRTMAEEAQTKLRAIDKKDIVGELLDLELNKVGISTLKIHLIWCLSVPGLPAVIICLLWPILWLWQL